MRIAFIVDQFPSLSETFILNQITGLIDRGHEVDIYCDRLGNTTTTHPEIQQYNLLERTYNAAIPTNFIVRVIKAVLLFSLIFFKAPKILLQVLNFTKCNRSHYGEQANFLNTIYLVIPWLNKTPYDILLCHYGRNGLKATLLKDLGLTNGKIVVIFHGYDISLYLKMYGYDIYDYLFKQVDLLQPISQHWQQKLISLGCNPKKVIVHHMGVDCQKFNYIAKQLNSASIHLVSIARLVEKKGLQYSIQAVAKLIERHPQLKYQIIGDGVLRENLQQLIEQLNLSNHVELLGWRKQQEVSRIIEESDIVIAPSVTGSDGDCEGIPVSLMESMAKGLPVISTYHSGIPELIEDGVSGYLLAEKDVDNLAHKIEQLIINPELRQKMGLAGRNKVKSDYNIEVLNDRLVQNLQRLMPTTANS